MIKIELVDNKDGDGCSFCGKERGNLVQVTEESHAGGGNHFILGRRCTRKLIAELEKFLKLNPSGVT